MGYEYKIPANQLGKLRILWVIVGVCYVGVDCSGFADVTLGVR